MQINPIKNVLYKNFSKFQAQQKTSTILPKRSEFSFTGGAKYEITGISEEFYDIFFKDMPFDLPKSDLLLKNGEYSPELGYMFLQLFSFGIEKAKNDNSIDKNEKKNFAFEYAQNVMYAHLDENGKYNFQNLEENSKLIYDIQKAGKAGDMSIFLYSAKNKDGYFSQKLAKSLLKIMDSTNCPSVIDAKLFINDYCLDDSDNVKDENVDSLIRLINTVGVEDVDWYHPCFYKKETREIMQDSVKAIEFIYNFFSDEKRENNDYPGFDEDLRRFALVLMLNSKNDETDRLDESVFYPRFEKIQQVSANDCRIMMNKVLHPNEN